MYKHDAARMRSLVPNLAEANDIPDLVSSADETSDDSSDSAFDDIEPPLCQSGYTFSEIHATMVSVTLTDEHEIPQYSGYTVMGGVNRFRVMRELFPPYYRMNVLLLPSDHMINICIGQISLA
jgi:hypothetical protein